MGKNAHLHIVLESDFLISLKNESRGRSISLSELCRLKLQTNLQLDRIEFMLKNVLKENERENRNK